MRMDPRPDYYKNLPSYFFIEDEDYNRVNFEKAAWAEYAWTHHTPPNTPTTSISTGTGSTTSTMPTPTGAASTLWRRGASTRTT